MLASTPEEILEKTAQIDICIASYKRPKLLAKLLTCLATQNLPADITLGVIVVDNDPAGSARYVVDSAMAAGLPVRYFMQPEKNIALTRNMGVTQASGEYIAFIDDDEYVGPDWLKNLYETLHKYQADVVFGPVNGELPPNAPAWLTEGHFFQQAHLETGTVAPVRGTGNVLLRADSLPDRSMLFDPKYGLSGGSDTDFFRRMQQSGKRFIWCEEALAWEAIPQERLTAEWWIRRSFRSGQVFAEIYVTPQSMMKKIPWFFYRSALVVVALVAGLIAWPLRKVWGVKCFQKVASNVGQLSSLFHHLYKEYGEK
jgi:succinoglycan biosynthesis protein ExoM